MKNERFIRYRFLIAVLVFALFIALAVPMTIAWLAAPGVAGIGRMEMTGDAPAFELAVKGNRIRHEEIFSFADSEYVFGMPGIDPDDSSEYYKTGLGQNGTENDQIMLRFNGTAEEAAKEIGPGGSGVFTFYVIPGQDGNLAVDFSLDIHGYIEKAEMRTVDEEQIAVVTDLLDITTLTMENSALTQEQITKRREALNYLQGHIFFFEEEGEPDDETAPYSYKKPLVDNRIHKEWENVQKGKLYPVTIYWMWPNTLGQITLKDGNRRYGLPVVKDEEFEDANHELTDKGKVVQRVQNQKAAVFMTEAAVTDEMIADSARYLTALSKGYNKADEMIGTYINYFLLEVTAEPGDYEGDSQ